MRKQYKSADVNEWSQRAEGTSAAGIVILTLRPGGCAFSARIVPR